MLAQERDVLGPADEAERDQVDPDPLTGAHVLEVLLGHGGQRRRLAGDVQALAAGDRPADLDLGVDLAVARPGAGHSQPYGAVGEIEDLVVVDGVGEAGPGDRHPLRVALEAVGAAHEGQAIAGLELGDAVDQRPDPQLWARQVLQDRYLAARAAGGVAHLPRRLGVLVGGAVREVQPRDVHARLDHPHEHLRVARGGADRGDDLRAAHRTAEGTRLRAAPLVLTR